MCSDEVAIEVSAVSKHYQIYEHPRDRLKQFFMPPMQRALKRNPTQYYRDFTALSDISFRVKRGQTVGIIGRNGSGKSTLLQIICGTLAPSSGTVKVNGRIAALLELGSGFNPEFSGRENVFLNGAILGLDRAQMERRFDEIAAFADIGEFLEQPVKNYSSGMQVRLAFAVSVCVEPDILVVDEALAVGDEAFQRKCFARIENIRDSGGTILFVNHGAQAVVQLSDQAILLDQGEIICSGRPKFVVNQYQRLMNASAESLPNLRAQILQTYDSADDKQQTAKDSVQQKNNEPEENKSEEQLEGFDPNLQATDITRLEERGAHISQVEITTLHGSKVNLLQMGKRYRLTYQVDFVSAARQVGMGFGVRTVSGLMVAGAATGMAKKLRVPQVSAGQKKSVSFEFTCNLLPGAYFVQCGVHGEVGGEVLFLSRVFDVYSFKVLPEKDSILTGLFDMNVLPAINNLPN